MTPGPKSRLLHPIYSTGSTENMSSILKPQASGHILLAGFNVGGADWPRPELEGVKEPEAQLEALRDVGFREAQLAHQCGSNMLRTFISTRSIQVFDASFHPVCCADKQPVYQLEVPQLLGQLDEVSRALNQATAAMPDGRSATGQPLNWAAYDAFFSGIARFNASLANPSEGIGVLLTLVEMPPRLIIECPSVATLKHHRRDYSFTTLWEAYQGVLCEMARQVVRRYAQPASAATKTTGGSVVTAIEFFNEPDYTWLPDESRIERSLNPGVNPCDKYVTELHLSQIPTHDQPGKSATAVPWGFAEQEFSEAVTVTPTPLGQFRWGVKFDLYVKCFAELHEQVSAAVRAEMARAGVRLALVSGSVTHNNLDWLARMHRANPRTFQHVDKVGIHPYHWPNHDIWDKEFVSNRDYSRWNGVSPRAFAADYCKRFDMLKELTRLVRSDAGRSLGLAGKKIWITEFGIPTKKLCPANQGAKDNRRLFIYQRGETLQEGIVAAVWEDKWDALFQQVSREYLENHDVEAFLFYTLREGLISESSDANHSNFSLHKADGTPRLEQHTHQRLKQFLSSLTQPRPQPPMNTTSHHSTSDKLVSMPGMTSLAERQFLERYAADTYTGCGEIVDLGCWLGSLTIPLLRGLQANTRPEVPRQSVHAYDIFIWQQWMDPFQQNPLIKGRYQAGDSFLPEFLRLVRPYDAQGGLCIYAGDLCRMGWNGKAIELLVVDAMKSWELAGHVVRHFYPFLIPGKSVVFHQDFSHFYEYWIHLIQYRLRAHFTLLTDLPDSAGAVFSYANQIRPELLTAEYGDAAFTDVEVEAAFDYSRGIIQDKRKHTMLYAAHAYAYLHRKNLTRAEAVIEQAFAAGLRLEGELKTVSDMIKKARNPAAAGPTSAARPQNREAASGAGGNRRIWLLEELRESQLLAGDSSQVALWQVTLDQEQSSALFLHPPARLKFALPEGGRGQLSFAVAMHPEVWDQANAGACRFLVSANGTLIWEREINPTANLAERCWQEYSIEIPDSKTGRHEIVLETQAAGTGTAHRWALWRTPMFQWLDARKETPSSSSLVATSGASSASEALAKVIQAHESGNAAEARQWLAVARQHPPGTSEQRLTLGYVSLNLGYDSEALDWFTDAVRMSPRLAHAHSSRALALQLTQQSAAALDEAQHALALDANDLVALKVLTRICLDQHRVAQAMEFCQRILALQPHDPDAAAMMKQCQAAPPTVQADALHVQLPTASGNPATVAPAKPAAVVSQKLASLEGLLGDFSVRGETWQSLGVEHLLHQLVVGDFKKPNEVFQKPLPLPPGPDGLPLPPVDLTMGYGAGNMDIYFNSGRRSYESLCRLLKAHQVELLAGDVMLDWGGASGRAVRNFLPEARRGVEVWGCDVHAPSIQWAQNHLSPPFKFFNSSVLPRIPFPDGTFKFIYGLSVMTHLIAMRDQWLLELRRVLADDGCLILTVHDEATWAWFRERGMPGWMPQEYRSLTEIPGDCVEIRGSRWEHCYTFFRGDYLRRIWGQYFDIREIAPQAEGYQTAVVMKKFARHANPAAAPASA